MICTSTRVRHLVHRNRDGDFRRLLVARQLVDGSLQAQSPKTLDEGVGRVLDLVVPADDR
jgi:hypothetical protein